MIAIKHEEREYLGLSAFMEKLEQAMAEHCKLYGKPESQGYETDAEKALEKHFELYKKRI